MKEYLENREQKQIIKDKKRLRMSEQKNKMN